MKRKIIFIIALAAFYSCQKKTVIGIRDIQVPSYYKKYDFYKHCDSIAELKGYEMIHTPEYIKQSQIDWKDNTSKNFLSIRDMLNGLMTYKKDDRFNYLKNEEGCEVKTINDNYEIYQLKYKNEELNGIATIYRTYFVILKDSAMFVINYSTYDNDVKKLKDYNNLVKSIENKCIDGAIFKSSIDKSSKKHVIAN